MEMSPMDKTQIKDMLALHGFSYHTLESGVRVSALVPGDPEGKSEEDPEVLVRATREGTRLESERHSSYEQAAARYVELVEAHREE
jgi:hypothetical protein